MKKILIINTAGMGLGGITTHILTYLDAVISDYPDLSVTIGVTGLRNNEIISHFQRLGCEIVDLPDRKTNVLSYAKAIYKLMRMHRFDVLHVHGNSGTMIIELLCGLLNHIPIRIAHCHNSISNHMSIHKVLGPVFKKTYTNAFACSEAAGKWIFDDNFSVLPNAIDTRKYKFDKHIRDKIRSSLDINERTLVIGHVGNFNMQKNQSFLLGILSKLLAKNDAKLLLIGQGPLFNMIKNEAREKGLEKNVIFAGLCENVNEYLQAMDVFAMPSLYEGLPVSLIEAQTAALPCVLSSTISKEGIFNGRVIMESLNAGVDKWVDDILKMHKEYPLSSRDEKISCEQFDILSCVKKLEDVYLRQV